MIRFRINNKTSLRLKSVNKLLNQYIEQQMTDNGHNKTTDIAIREQNKDAPEITYQLMTDPVFVEESGQTYERKAILTHFETSYKDPLTNIDLDSKNIRKNYLVLKILTEIRKNIYSEMINDMTPQQIFNLVQAFDTGDMKGYEDHRDSRSAHP